MMHLLLSLLLLTQGTAQDLYNQAVKLYRGFDGPKNPYKAAELLQTAVKSETIEVEVLVSS